MRIIANSAILTSGLLILCGCSQALPEAPPVKEAALMEKANASKLTHKAVPLATERINELAGGIRVTGVGRKGGANVCWPAGKTCEVVSEDPFKIMCVTEYECADDFEEPECKPGKPC